MEKIKEVIRRTNVHLVLLTTFAAMILCGAIFLYNTLPLPIYLSLILMSLVIFIGLLCANIELIKAKHLPTKYGSYFYTLDLDENKYYKIAVYKYGVKCKGYRYISKDYVFKHLETIKENLDNIELAAIEEKKILKLANEQLKLSKKQLKLTKQELSTWGK